MIRIICCAVILLSGIGFAWADGPTTKPAATQPVRDPTEAEARLKQALEPPAATKPFSHIPQIIRRGFVQAVGQAPEALIEVQGSGLFMIHQGSTIVVSLGPDASTIMHVTKVAADGIEVDFSDAGQSVVVP